MNSPKEAVFINCPFDTTYHALMHSILFTVSALGFQPRISLESTDSSEIRLEKIKRLISESAFSIHDLSKIKAVKKDEFFRLNMPFELGIDYGCREYSGEALHKSKKFLILGAEKYDYMKALSDLSGVDIHYHNNQPIQAVKEIRHWFVANSGLKYAPSPNEIWMKSMDFNAEYYKFAHDKGYSDEEMYSIPIKEQLDMISRFVTENPF